MTAIDDTYDPMMDIVMMDIAGVEMLGGSKDMPEDLSAKHRTVSVQTETCNQERFEQILDGFSQEQIKHFMDILIHFASKTGNFQLSLYQKVFLCLSISKLQH